MRQRDKAAAILAAALVLSGCMGGEVGAGSGAADWPRAPARVQVMSKGFTIAGPRGFCIDESATRETEAGAFVLLGSCSAISGNPGDAKPALPAVLTASVAPATGPFEAPDLDRLAAYFSSQAGRATLSRAEDGAPVEVLDLGREPGLVLVHARDDTVGGQLASDYWRGVFQAAGQLVTVTVSGFREGGLDVATGGKLARDFVAAIRAANGVAPNAAAPAATAGLRGFFNRLL